MYNLQNNAQDIFKVLLELIIIKKGVNTKHKYIGFV